jgi:hypothetical protein
MKQITIFFLCFLFFSCSLKKASTRNAANTKSLALEWTYPSKITENLRLKLDSTIEVVMKQFNNEKHSFDVHKKTPIDKDYLTINFQKAKVVKNGEKIAGYIVSAIGLVVIPYVLIASESPFILVFYYYPQHRLVPAFTLSPSLSSGKNNKISMLLSTGALFVSTDKQVNKLLNKFLGALNKTLSALDKQLQQN